MTLQHALQRVTHNLPTFVGATGRAILGTECYTTLIYDVAPTSDCARLALSKALGIGIIVFGSILKLPQMYTIVRNKSAWGIALSMYALEVVAYDISLAYAVRRALPFSTYGENASLTVQNMIITLLIIWYAPLVGSEGGESGPTTGKEGDGTRRLRLTTAQTRDPAANARRVALAALGMLFGSIFLFLLCPPPLLSILQALSIPISLASKFPQIAELHRNRQTGHLSSIVVFAQLAGTLARVFTTVTETGDWLLGVGFGAASVLNAVIAVQYVYYWNGAKQRDGTTLPLTTPRSAALNNAGDGSWEKREGEGDRHTSHKLTPSMISITVPDDPPSTAGSGYALPSGRRVHEKGRRAD